jgi:hypothetical protein
MGKIEKNAYKIEKKVKKVLRLKKINVIIDTYLKSHKKDLADNAKRVEKKF